MSDRDGVPDTFRLDRFVEAQAPVIEQVRDELRAGRKTSHWMWFVFPQIVGLGHSTMAQRYAISGLDEATAYMAHPVLGPRLIAVTRLVLEVEGRSIEAIFGSPDWMKFRSSMTLFDGAAPADPVFGEALRRYFDGRPDESTLQKLHPRPR